MTPADWLRTMPQEDRWYVLRLYITGMSARSTEAVATVKRICEERLPNCYELDIIDLYQTPSRAREDQIVATPTLVRQKPSPCRRLIGNLGNIDRVLGALIVAR